MTRTRVATLVVSTLLLASSAFASKSGDAWERFQEAKWSTTRTLAQVPSEVLSALRPHLAGDPRLAGAGEPFDPTGVSTSLPSRRLVLAGHSTADWFIVYEQGGPTHHLVFVDFEMAQPEPQPVLLATGTAGVHDAKIGWRLDLHQLMKGLQSGTMHWGDANAATY